MTTGASKGDAKNSSMISSGNTAKMWATCVASEAERSIATKFLNAMKKADDEAGRIIEENEAQGREPLAGLFAGMGDHDVTGRMADNYFLDSLTLDEASTPFVHMLLMFGANLHWNDVGDVCVWVLGFSSWRDYLKSIVK